MITNIAGQFDDCPNDQLSLGVLANKDKPIPNGAVSYEQKHEWKSDDQCILEFDPNEEEFLNDDKDDEDFYYDLDDAPLVVAGNKSYQQSSSAALTVSDKLLNMSSHTVRNSASAMEKMETHKRTLHIDRNDRATSEQVLDPRTRLILFKMLNTGFLEKLDGCLSTGKEANVYYALAGKRPILNSMCENSQEFPKEYAIKIYKTSILVFKDRDKYVTGEHRWRKGYCKSNPRKMVKVWAEKELRNYRRIHKAGIPTPQPILLKQHVLVMEFLGHEGWPSPRLKDAQLTDTKLRQAYVQSVLILRHLYQRCKLVHGDYSEYNLLWHNHQVYVIDVSQSVETDHPSALDFLRSDVSNVNDYFRKVGRLTVMTTRQLFEFVTMTIPTTGTVEDEDQAELDHLDTIMRHVEAVTAATASVTSDQRRQQEHQQSVDEAVFMSSFLPRSLNQVAEHEIRKLEAGEMEESYASAIASLLVDTNQSQNDSFHSKDFVSSKEKEATIARVATTALKYEETCMNDISEEQPLEKVKNVSFVIACDSESEDCSTSPSNDDDERESLSEVECGYIKVPRTPEELQAERETLKLQRKTNKKVCKEEKSDKRKDKIKKKDKRRAIKKSKAGNRKK